MIQRHFSHTLSGQGKVAVGVKGDLAAEGLHLIWRVVRLARGGQFDRPLLGVDDLVTEQFSKKVKCLLIPHQIFQIRNVAHFTLETANELVEEGLADRIVTRPLDALRPVLHG